MLTRKVSTFPVRYFLRKLAQDPQGRFDRSAIEPPKWRRSSAAWGRRPIKSSASMCRARSTILPKSRNARRGGFLGRQRIVVLDTATTSAGLGLIVEKPRPRQPRPAAPQAEIVRIVRGMIPHMYALFFSDTLEYLETWGRLGSAQALLGTMLDLKPLATMEDGDLLADRESAQLRRAVDKLYDFIIEFSQHRADVYLAAWLRGRSRPVT